MRKPFLAASVLAVLALVPGTAGIAAAQDHTQHNAGATMACCATHEMAPAPAAAKAMPCCDANDLTIAAAGLGLPEKPVVQRLAVTFREPVRVGGAVLFGRYVIEHDDARMARGEPCTYIFEAGDRRLPVVTFHCTHLERLETSTATVVLGGVNQSGVREFREFQYAGDVAAHGVPVR